MSKFNKTKEKVVPTTVNEMGEKAYQLDAKSELIATCLTTFLQKSYYETENEIVDRVKNAVDKVDENFVAKLAIYLRKDANMRSVTHLLAGELAPKLSGKEYASRFYRKISVRPDDMSEILAYHFSKGNKKISNAMKRGFRTKLESMDPYLIDKYKMNKKDISLVDLVNLFHPTPTKSNAEAYKRLINGESLDGLYSTKIMEKVMSNAGKVAKETGRDVVELKAEAIAEVLSGDAPIMNLIRNLRNIITISPKEVPNAIKQLTNKDKILNSRLLPFRFVSAYTEIERLNNDIKTDSTIKFESDVTPSKLIDDVLNALEVALQYSVKNIPSLEGNTAVLIDHSGSVRGDSGGSSKVSAFSKVNTAMIGNLFGSMLAYSQRDVYIGLFGDRLINVPIDRTKGLLEFNKYSFSKGADCGPNTEKGLFTFLNEVIANKTRVDNLVIFSDMVIEASGYGGWGGWGGNYRESFQDLFKKFKQVNPQCNTICVDIRQTSGKSVFDKSLNILQIAGWSDKIFNLIEANCKGYEALIKEIESIKI